MVHPLSDRLPDLSARAKRAERAEDHAAHAIFFAMDAIDYAEPAVIDALIARAAADTAASV